VRGSEDNPGSASTVFNSSQRKGGSRAVFFWDSWERCATMASGDGFIVAVAVWRRVVVVVVVVVVAIDAFASWFQKVYHRMGHGIEAYLSTVHAVMCPGT
jgi:hypothetical protein